MNKPTENFRQIKMVLDGLFDTYPSYSRLADEAAAVWCLHLEDVPLESIKAAAFSWSREHPWPPNSMVRFMSSIKRRVHRPVEPDPPGLAEFLVEYRKGGYGVGSTPPGHEHEEGRRTPGHEASVHWSIIKDITFRQLRCPRSVARHDIFAVGDKEEQWYWHEFKRRMAR